jgi:hypothetical protein
VHYYFFILEKKICGADNIWTRNVRHLYESMQTTATDNIFSLLYTQQKYKGYA